MAQYGTTDLMEALNFGAMDECDWVEDVEGVNGGFPIPHSKQYETVMESVVPHSPFSVYPNPAQDILIVETAPASSLGKGAYRITNLMGQTLQSGNISGGRQALDVSSLSPGIYLLTLEGATRKFVVGY